MSESLNSLNTVLYKRREQLLVIMHLKRNNVHISAFNMFVINNEDVNKIYKSGDFGILLSFNLKKKTISVSFVVS